MEDVARECGVTKKTVSRVFAGSPAVKASTREKILEAAKRLNYEFNTLAQNFSSKRSRFIGVATAINQLVGTSYFGELMRGFASVLNETEMDFALFDTDTESFNNGEKLAKLYRQRRVDGLLVVAPHTYDRFLDTLEQVRVPMVVVGVQPSCEGVCSVSCNDKRGIDLLCSHLYRLGHRRIAFVSGPAYVTTSELRTQAYVDFCREKRLKNPPEYIQPGNYSIPTGREAARRLFQLTPRPTAVVAANDLTAFGVIEAAQEFGLKVPEDVSITGFDDFPTGAERSPTLTTIHQPVLEMGQQSVTSLINALRKGKMPSGHSILDVKLMERESTAQAKSSPQEEPIKRSKKRIAVPSSTLVSG